MKSAIIATLFLAESAAANYLAMGGGACGIYADAECTELVKGAEQTWTLADKTACIGISSTAEVLGVTGATTQSGATLTCSSTQATLTIKANEAMDSQACGLANSVGVGTFATAELKVLKDKGCAKYKWTGNGATVQSWSVKCTTYTGAELCTEPPVKNNSSDDAPHAAPALAAVAMVAASLVMLQ